MPNLAPDPVVRLGLLQCRCSADPDDNVDRALAQAGRAVQVGARILCTAELFRTPYFCQAEDHAHFQWAEPIPGPTTERFQEFARRQAVVVLASVFEKRAPGVYHNSVVVVDADGSLLGIYRKMHVPDDPLYYEKFYFTPGDLGFRSWQTRYARIGVLICWDQWFPEAARLTALRGAEILFFPTAIGWHPREKALLGTAQHSAWEIIQRSHAVANGCYVATVNRVGLEQPIGGDGLEFWGRSFVADPCGQLLDKAAADKEQELVVSVDLRHVETTRTHWPFLRDRRIDAYEGITRRWLD